ncbi:O-antigen ligase family protein [Candidatus Poribacteria bacterium]|nr:O-antigen ligase family protein [Candidatus Poribacteria bacterium]MYK21281.1 O-antigen ligase family protein [Candidatus Poribacteria bacterium]
MSKLKLPFPARFTSETVLDTATYIGFLIFVLALPFGYSTACLNIGLSLVAFGWVGRIVSERKLGWQRTPLDIPIALFLALALIACLLAPHPSTSSLGYFWKLLRAILLFYAVIHSRLGYRWKHIVIAFIAAAGISSALGLWYYANDTRLAIDFMGRVGLQFKEELKAGASPNLQISDEFRTELRACNVPLSQNVSISPSNRFPDEWRINDPARQRRYVIRPNETHLMVYMIEQRLTGTFKMPNDLGAYLALSLPFVMGYFVASWRRDTKQKLPIWIILVLGAIVVVMSANLVLTLTRAAWVSTIIAIVFLGVYFIVIAFRKLSEAPVHGLGKRPLFGSIIIIVLLSLSLFLVPQHIKTRFQTMIEHPVGFMGERPEWWQTALELIQKYSLTGIGLGRFRYEYQTSGPGPPPVTGDGQEQYNVPYHAHNIYLHIAVEHGIPSLLLFLWIVVIIYQQIFAGQQASDFWGRGTFIGASGFLISALVYGLADNILHQRTVLLFYLIIGIIFFLKPTKDKKHEKISETG